MSSASAPRTSTSSRNERRTCRPGGIAVQRKASGARPVMEIVRAAGGAVKAPGLRDSHAATRALVSGRRARRSSTGFGARSSPAGRRPRVAGGLPHRDSCVVPRGRTRAPVRWPRPCSCRRTIVVCGRLLPVQRAVFSSRSALPCRRTAASRRFQPRLAGLTLPRRYGDRVRARVMVSAMAASPETSPDSFAGGVPGRGR